MAKGVSPARSLPPLPLLTTLALFLSTSAQPIFATSAANSSSIPQIDYGALGTTAIVGSFAGISFYNPASLPTNFSATASTLLARHTDGTLTSAGATNTGGMISAICQNPSNGLVFIGGTFTSIGGEAATNIASYNPTSQVYSGLKSGLDGPVLALSCNGTTVYAGGNFTGPIGATTTPGFEGNVAAWSIATSEWSPLPFAGLNGPVSTIVPSLDGKSLFFGGTFTTTYSNITNIAVTNSSTTAATYSSIGMSLVPISLSGSTVAATPTTTTTGYTDVQSIFCPAGNDGVGSSWLMQDGLPGSITANFYRPIGAMGVRIGNTFVDGRGVQNFSVVSLPDNKVLTLSYATNPSDSTSTQATCSSNCPLAHNSSIPYQDFLFDSSSNMTGFQIDVTGWYGAGGGLHLLSLLSEGAYDYAVTANNLSPCKAGLGKSTESAVATYGNWTQTTVVTSIPGTTQDILVGHVPGGSLVSSSPTIFWTPYIVADGNYSVYLVTPGCSINGDCASRTTVNATVLTGEGDSVTVNVDQTNTEDVSTLLYSGLLHECYTTYGGVQVILSLAQGHAPPSGTDFSIVADYISLVALNPAGTTNETAKVVESGHGLFEFPLVGTGTFGDAVPSTNLNGTGTLTNLTAVDTLAFRLSNGSVIHSITTTGSGNSTIVFVGGSFTYESIGGQASTNVVAYSKSAVILAPNGGLAGTVTSLVVLNGVLYAAGAFTATADGKITGLNGAAQWAFGQNGTAVWQSMGQVPNIGGSIVELGLAGTGTNISIVAAGGGGSGLAFYDPAPGAWNATEAGLFIGNLSAIGSSSTPSNSTSLLFLAGNVVSAGGTAAPGGAVISSASGVPSLTSFGFNFDTASASTSAANSTATTTANSTTRAKRMDERSRFSSVFNFLQPRSTPSLATTSPVTSLPSAISPTATAQVLAGAFWKNGTTSYMVLGGNFETTNGTTDVGLYNPATKTMTSLPGETISGAVTAVAVISNVAWFGGEFTTATGRQGLTTYNLATQAPADIQSALTGYTGTNATVNVIVQRPGFDTTVIIGGAFSAAGSTACQSICSWDTKTSQWSTLGSGLNGVVGSISFAGSNSENLLAAGSFTLNGTTAFLAQWHFSNSSWTTLGLPTDLPGPATAVSSDNTNESKIFVAGQSTADNSPYFLYWDGSTWANVNNGTLQNGSGVQQLVFVPLTSDHASNNIIESNRMLMVSGELTINNTNVASALFDGDSWYPYLLASSATGSAGAVSQFFFSITNFSLSGRHYLAVGLVILISIAIALGVVFLLVVLGLLFALMRRKDEPNYPAKVQGDTGSVSIQHRPTSLLATVGAATAVLLDSKKQPLDHDSVAGPRSFDGGMSYDSQNFEQDAAARVRYSFEGEHPGELTVRAGEDLTILDGHDPNWWLVVSNTTGQRGLIPSTYLV